jgi:hypothetical protein
MMLAKYRYLATPAAAFAVALTIALAAPAIAQSQSDATPAPASPQSQKQLDLAAARAGRKAIFGQNMNLTDDEAKSFWPLFDAYESRMDKIEDRHVREIKDFAKHYQNLSEVDAKAKLDEVMAIMRARLETQIAYIPKFRSVLTQVQTTRFFQIDNKLHALVQCQIAQMVPLAQDTGAVDKGGRGL